MVPKMVDDELLLERLDLPAPVSDGKEPNNVPSEELWSTLLKDPKRVWSEFVPAVLREEDDDLDLHGRGIMLT
jgi:hypothetical protein